MWARQASGCFVPLRSRLIEPIFMKYLIFLSILCVNWASAQTVDSVQFRQQLNDYQAHLRTIEGSDLEQIGRITDLFWNEKFTQKESSHYFFQFCYPIQYQLFSAQKIRKIMAKYYPTAYFVERIPDEDFAQIHRDAHFIDLINWGFVSPHYPFATADIYEWQTEVNFYNIQPTDRIAEIGAGKGLFGLMLAIHYPDTEIYLNEIEPYLTQYIEEKVQSCPPKLLPVNIQVIRGRKKSTELEGMQLDKIIIRNTFHHFDKSMAMLESIRLSLAPGGQLFLLEKWAKAEPNLTDCSALLDKSSLLDLLQSAGFQLVKEQSISYGQLLQFQYQ